MERTKGYETAQAAVGENETLKLGGHICVVKSVNITQSKSGREMLMITFDIDSSDEQAGFFNRKYEKMLKFNGAANYPGVHRILTQDNSGETNPYFKGFITSIESSNQGYSWNWDENSLVGKKFGAVFGREEYEKSTGEYAFATKIFYIKSTEGIFESKVPEDKLLQNKVEPTVEVDDDDLPF